MSYTYLKKKDNFLSISQVLITFMLIVSAKVLRGDESKERCNFEESSGTLKCSDLLLGDDRGDEILMLNLTTLMPLNETHLVDQLIIENSTIPTLNLNFIGINQLTRLSGISIHECNITRVVGDIPCHLSRLRLSNNQIQNFTARLLDYGKEESSKKTKTNDEEKSDSQPQFLVVMSKKCFNNFSIDLANNRLEELPVQFVTSRRLKSLHLTGNPLKCEFIWETVWDYLECSERHEQCRQLFGDQNSTSCQFYRHSFSSGIFHYSLAQIFDSKMTLEAECSEMNKTCSCHPFNLLRGEDGKPTAYLKVTCVGQNLTHLPRISEYTWELNVTNNKIVNLNRLNTSDYRNLRILDVSDNMLDDLMSITNTGFMRSFDMLFINYNRIQKIPDAFLLKVKNSEGKGIVRIGSHLECECYTATSTKGRIIEIQNKIVDLNDLMCGNLINDTTNEPLKLRNLKLADVCPIPNPNADEFDWMVAIITLEILCIFGVIVKVFYDWRNYQRTGVLPWIAEKLPRLPCDGILE